MVGGYFLWPPHGTTPAAVITNKNKMFRSFKSKENIRIADGPYLGFGYKSLISDPMSSGKRGKYCKLANLTRQSFQRLI